MMTPSIKRKFFDLLLVFVLFRCISVESCRRLLFLNLAWHMHLIEFVVNGISDIP